MAFSIFTFLCSHYLYVFLETVPHPKKGAPHPLGSYFPQVGFSNKEDVFYRQAWKGGHSFQRRKFTKPLAHHVTPGQCQYV